MRFLAVQHFTGKNLGAELPGGQSNIAELPVKNLPGTGQYDWTLAVKTDAYGDICKQSGWIEMGGSGMVDPYLYEFAGWGPEEYTGFAFGMGIERTAQLRYGISGIRPFWENDLRFLRQFR